MIIQDNFNKKVFYQKGAILIEFAILLTLAFAFVAVNDMKEPIKELALNKIEDRNINADAYKFGGLPNVSTSGVPVVDEPEKKDENTVFNPVEKEDGTLDLESLVFNMQSDVIWGNIVGEKEKKPHYDFSFTRDNYYSTTQIAPLLPKHIDLIHFLEIM